MQAASLKGSPPLPAPGQCLPLSLFVLFFFFFHLLLLLSSVFFGVLLMQKAMQKPQDSTAVAMRTREIGTLIFVKHSSWDTRWRGSVGDRGEETIMPFFCFLFQVMYSPFSSLFVAFIFTCVFSPCLEKPLPSYPNLFVYQHFIDFFFLFFFFCNELL